MRILITGASGFIGSHAVRELLAADHAVMALALENDPLWRLRDLLDRIQVLRGDLADLDGVRPLLKQWQPGACLHLAWYAEPGKYLHSPENVPALINSLNLLRELLQLGCRQFVMAGTCAEYDTTLGYLNEDSPTRPATIYASTKLALGLIGQQLAAAAQARFAWGRIFYLYGPYEDKRRMVPALIDSLLNGRPFSATAGEQVRDYLHVADVAKGLRILLEQSADGMFNLASSQPLTVRQLMETIGEITGRSDLIRFGALPYRNWEPPFICGDNQRLRALGWQPQYALRAGLQETVAWWKNEIDH